MYPYVNLGLSRPTYFNFSPPICLFTVLLLLGFNEESIETSNVKRKIKQKFSKSNFLSPNFDFLGGLEIKGYKKSSDAAYASVVLRNIIVGFCQLRRFNSAVLGLSSVGWLACVRNNK